MVKLVTLECGTIINVAHVTYVTEVGDADSLHLEGRVPHDVALLGGIELRGETMNICKSDRAKVVAAMEGAERACFPRTNWSAGMNLKVTQEDPVTGEKTEEIVEL